MNGYYDPSQYTPGWGYYLLAIPLVIAGICWVISTMNPGSKVRIYKTVSGRRVRDWDAERELARKTRP